MGDIVYYSSQELDKAKVFTNSRMVAERFGKLHKNVIQTIEKQMEMNKVLGAEDFNRLSFKPVEYKDEKGEMRKMYEMNEDGFLSIATSFTGIEAHKIRLLLITEFRRMESELQKRSATREIGVEIRNRMTDTIKEIYEGDKLGFKIKAFTDLAYTVAIGKNCKKFREDLELDKKANVRDYLNADQLKKLEQAETVLSFLYQSCKTYEEIKAIVLGEKK